MSRTAKTLGFSVPPTIVKEVETLAREERRTKSELSPETVGVYRRSRGERDRDEPLWVAKLIREGKAEDAQNPMTTDEIVAQSDRLAGAAARRAKKLGVSTGSRSVNRLIHERRKLGRSA